MGKGENLDRGNSGSQALTCVTCGASNRLAPSMLELGYQSCAHCDAAIAVAGVGAFAIETGVGVTRVVSPGQSLFRIAPMEMLDLPHLALFLLGGDAVSLILRHLLRVWGAPSVVSWLPVLAFLLFAFIGLVLVFGSQQILVTQNRVETWIPLMGKRLWHRRFGTHGLQMRLTHGRRHVLWLQPRGDKPVRIIMATENGVRTLQDQVKEACTEARVSGVPDAVPCPGCGASVGTSMKLLRERGVECKQCGAGVVATREGAMLGDVELAYTLSVEIPEDLEETRRCRVPGGWEWQMGPELLVRPGFAAGLMALGLVAGGGGMTVGVGVLVMSAPWYGFGALFTLCFGGLGLLFLGMTIRTALGRHRLVVDDTVLVHELHLGPWRVRRRAIPLPRLLSFKVEVDVAEAEVHVRTAVDEFRLALPFLAGQGALVAAELYEEVEERLARLGRVVISTKRETIGGTPVLKV